MPRHRAYYSRKTYVFPEDFSVRLDRFKKESGLSWAGVEPPTRHLHPDHEALAERRALRSTRHIVALLELAEALGLGHLFISSECQVRGTTRSKRDTKRSNRPIHQRSGKRPSGGPTDDSGP